MVLDGLKCVRCLHELELVESVDFEDDETGITHYFHCPYCGADFEITEPTEEQKKEYDFWKDPEGHLARIDHQDVFNGHCINCGHKIGVSGNFMLSDYDDTTKESADKMNFVLTTCENCGCSEVRWDTSEDDQKIYPYWKKAKEENKNDEK